MIKIKVNFLQLICGDLKLAFRQIGDIFSVLFFFIIVVSLFPLGIGADLDLLKKIAAGIIWVAALLSTMLSLNKLFANDFADGSLEQLMLLPVPLSLVVFSKILAHWIISGLPLAIFSPILGIQFNLSGEELWVLILSLLLGTPALSAIGAIGSALTIGLKSSSVLLSLLILPLYIPILIFGSGAIDSAISGMEYSAHLSLILAITLSSLFLSPFAAAMAIRTSME